MNMDTFNLAKQFIYDQGHDLPHEAALLVSVRYWMTDKIVETLRDRGDPAAWQSARDRAPEVADRVRQLIKPLPSTRPEPTPVSMPGNPGASLDPLNNTVGGLSVDDIQNMSVEEYAKLRQRLGVPEALHY
jgi:hypothetical protein